METESQLITSNSQFFTHAHAYTHTYYVHNVQFHKYWGHHYLRVVYRNSSMTKAGNGVEKVY